MRVNCVYNRLMPAAHIALNAHLLSGRSTYRSAGIHHYIDQLLRHLPAAGADWQYTVFVGEGQPGLPGAAIRRTHWPTGQPLVRLLWEQICQPVELWRARPDLLHSLAFVLPLVAPCPAVVTVYDLAFKRLPQTFLPAQRLYLSAFTAQACRRARRVLAISESTRADVARLFGVAADKIDVAYPGVAPEFRQLPAADLEAFRARRGLPPRFILYLGTLEPRKNLGMLIQAFAELHARYPDLKLVLAGAKGWLYADLFKQAQALQLEQAILFPGFVPAEERVLWYNAAAVFVYPSTYEGFGLPVVEALACGRPVVTTTAASLPEAGGAAAVLVAPHDGPALAAAITRALGLEPEQLQSGPAHAARFTWAATAAQTIASYRRALAG